MKVLFIVNPAAGKGHSMKIVPIIKSTIETITDVEYAIIYTEKPGHAVEIAKAGASDKYDIVFAVGGDGTVNEVANGLVHTDTALGVIPGGSGNDFIKSLGISGDVKDIIIGTITGTKRLIDVGLINDRYFVNISSVGFDAEVVLETQKAKKYFLSGSAAYVAGLISTIFTRKPSVIKMIIGDLEISEKALLVAVANGKYYGGGMKAAPEAVIDDGLFDICFIRAMTKIKMLFLFPQYMKGKHKKFKEVSFYRSNRVYIESKDLISINIDGEVFRDKSAIFEIIKDGLCIVVPGKK